MQKQGSIQTFCRVKAPAISHVGFSWRTHIDSTLLTTGVGAAVDDRQVQIYTLTYNTADSKARHHSSSVPDLHDSV